MIESIEGWFIFGGLSAAFYLAMEAVTRLTRIRQHTRKGFMLAWALFLGHQWLKVPEDAEIWIKRVLLLATLMQGWAYGLVLIDVALERLSSAHGRSNPSSRATIALLGTTARVGLGLLLVVLGLNNVGVNVTALVAGLGVGGIAVALAAQSLLTDLLASITIVLDQPFGIGELVSVEGVTGTVDRIGIKTTRIRAQTGETVIFPNQVMVRGALRNHSRQNDARVAFRIEIANGARAEDVAAIPSWIGDLVSKTPGIAFESAHVVDLSGGRIQFEVAYQVSLEARAGAKAAHHEILVGILRECGRRGLVLAA